MSNLSHSVETVGCYGRRMGKIALNYLFGLACSVRVDHSRVDCRLIIPAECTNDNVVRGVMSRVIPVVQLSPCLVILYILYGHTYSKSMDQPGKVANPARGQLNKEN